MLQLTTSLQCVPKVVFHIPDKLLLGDLTRQFFDLVEALRWIIGKSIRRLRNPETFQIGGAKLLLPLLDFRFFGEDPTAINPRGHP